MGAGHPDRSPGSRAARQVKRAGKEWRAYAREGRAAALPWPPPSGGTELARNSFDGSLSARSELLRTPDFTRSCVVSCGGCVRHGGLDGDAGPTWKPDGASVTRSKWRRAARSRPREPDAPGPISRPLAPPGAGARWRRRWTTRRRSCTAARPAPRLRPSRPEPRSPTWSVEATGCAASAALGRGAAAREPSQQQAALQCSAAAGRRRASSASITHVTVPPAAALPARPAGHTR